MKQIKIIRTATVSGSMVNLIKGQLQFLNQFYEIVAVAAGEEKLKFVGEREGVRTKAVHMERKIDIVKDVKSLISLYRLFRKEKPAVVHSMTPKAGLLSMMAAYYAGVPVRLHTFTGLIFPTETGMKQKLLIAMDRLLCHYATNIYPEGKGVKDDLIKFKITRKPLKVLANGNINGIDTTYFSPEVITESDKKKLKEQLGIDDSDFIFIFVGRIVKDKGINELIAAFDKLTTTSRNAKLLLVGELNQKTNKVTPETEKIINENPAIIAVGYQTDVRPFYAISDALAFPSYREGFPNVVMQAAAMALPSIVTDISGSNEIILAGSNGVIIPVREEDALFAAMENFITNPEYVSKLQRNARPSIVERYERKHVWDAVLNEYQTLLE